MTDLLTLLGTALNKRPEQLRGVAERSVKSALLPRLPVDVDARYEDGIPDDPATDSEPVERTVELLRRSTASRRERFRDRSMSATGGTLTFLNKSIEFGDGDRVSLSPDRLSDYSSHWKLKCWGFEHLRWAWLGYGDSLPEEQRRVHRHWLDEWLDGHPIAREPGYLRREWMPHSVCLRIVNWGRYGAAFGNQLTAGFRSDIARFVHKNAAFLSDNIEHGVGGNHLVENAIALLLAGVYLDVPAWRRQARAIFEQTATTQFLGDGGHFERSPMYHAIVCQRYVSAHSLMESIGEESVTVSKCARNAAKFLMHLHPPDGRIPLLNDAVFDEALRLEECLTFAESVGLVGESVDATSVGPGQMDETGYYWLGEYDDRMLVAAHDIAVPHVPAHAHAHPGQVCLWIDGERVLTDTGVFEYETGSRRQRARSVRSHNTVQVDGGEPARMASSFWLWGHLDPEVVVDGSGRSLDIAYAVDVIGRPSYRHRRTVERDGTTWMITDHVDAGSQSVVSRLHVHPRFQAQAKGGSVDIVDQAGDRVLRIEPFGADPPTLKEAPYFPRFGEAIDRDVILLQPSESAREAFGAYLIARPDPTTTEGGQDRNHPRGD